MRYEDVEGSLAYGGEEVLKNAIVNRINVHGIEGWIGIAWIKLARVQRLPRVIAYDKQAKVLPIKVRLRFLAKSWSIMLSSPIAEPSKLSLMSMKVGMVPVVRPDDDFTPNKNTFQPLHGNCRWVCNKLVENCVLRVVGEKIMKEWQLILVITRLSHIVIVSHIIKSQGIHNQDDCLPIL